MRAWLVSWILRLLRRLTAWLSRPEVEAPRHVSWEGAPEHWIRRAAPPPPAHWLARVRTAVPLEAVESAPQTPAPAGVVPQTVAPPPQRRRAEPALPAPKRPSSPDAPPAGKGGPSFPPRAACPEPPRPVPEPAGQVPERKVRVFTRIEEEVPPRSTPRPSDLCRETAPWKSPVDFRTSPSPRRPFDVVDEAPPAEPRRVAPPSPPLPERAPRTSVELAAPGTKPPVRFVPEHPRAPHRRAASPSRPVESAPVGRFVPPLSEPEPAGDEAEALSQTARGTASSWPELAARPPEDDDEPWRAAALDAERRRRLDLEQRGKPWSE